jgi:protein MPE1
MASSVFYKFASQKTESRVTFDGTGISVFDLKKEVILANNLGKANDFDLFVYDSANQGLQLSVPCQLQPIFSRFLRVQK